MSGTPPAAVHLCISQVIARNITALSTTDQHHNQGQTPMQYKPITQERIESKVEKVAECGCWIWMGSITTRGYGQILSNNKTFYAHRASYMAFKGEIPEGQYVCHKCDTVSCVNPEHLFLGTQKQNLQDMARKGRSTIGERNPQAKLTVEQVLQIREMQGSHQEIADLMNISRSNVGLIKNRGRWNHV